MVWYVNSERRAKKCVQWAPEQTTAHSMTALVSSDGRTGSAVHVHCTRLCDGCNEYRERLRQARRAVAGGRRAVADLNRDCPIQHTSIGPMYVGWSEALATLAKCLTNVVNQSIFITEKVKKYTMLRTLHYILCFMGRTKQPIIKIILQNVARTLTLAQCLTNVVNQSIFKCFIITPKVKKHTM